MRNPLAHAASAGPSFRERLAGYRERLAAARARAGQAVAASRILLAPPPAPEPAVDRAALVNYATFLHHERRAVCAELYPHLGRRADRFVLSMNAADRFFFTDDEQHTRRPESARASARAIDVLARVGIDWRADAAAGGVVPDREGRCVDTGARPALPHGWPAPDAALLQALDDLTRLDAAQRAIYEAGDPSRNGDEVPGYADLEEARDAALERLAGERAESLTGLQVKARALLAPSVEEGSATVSNGIALSLARDLLGLGLSAVEPRPDPVFAVIEETRRLSDEHVAACNTSTPNDRSDPPEVIERRNGACDDLWSYIDDTLLKTVPRTAEGCKALARFAGDFARSQGVSLMRQDDGGRPDPVLALIARSPLL